MSLALDRVAITLGGRPLVSGVSLELNPGEVVGLLGPNGAGKTTTFNLITGLLRPDEGDVRLDGLSVTRLAMPQRARLGIGYLPQEASVFRNLSVRENLELALQESQTPRSLRQERLESLIDDFHLVPFQRRKGFQLSGGERRRCEVARALAVGEKGPRYLLLDEPFAGVDPLAVNAVNAFGAQIGCARLIKHEFNILIPILLCHFLPLWFGKAGLWLVSIVIVDRGLTYG